MEYTHFIKLVKERAGLDTEQEALTAIEATLGTLSERLAGDEPANLAAQLPGELKPYMHSPGKGEPFDVETFFDRVAKLERFPNEQANKHARAVMTTVAEAVSGGEAADFMAQLPVEFSQVFILRGDFLTESGNWT